jgi:hypothetical protein
MLLENVIATRLVDLLFYETQQVITALANAHHFSPVLSSTLYFFKNYFNSVLATLRFPT